MRKELKKIEGERDLFIARFVREGSKTGFKGAPLPTILLMDIRRVSDNKLMCDHLWFNKTKAFTALPLTPGLTVQFSARVKQYKKGYLGKRVGLDRQIKEDFKLSHPTQVEIAGGLRKGKTNIEATHIIRKAKRVN